MTSSNYELGSYKPVSYDQDDEHDHGPEVKYISNFRQNSKFSEEFTPEDSSDGDHVRFRRMTAWDQFIEHANDFWVWELGAVVLSLGFLAVVIWLLIYLDGTPFKAWKPVIEPNTVLAIFITLSKSCMLVSVASGIAQLRWLHYESAPRNLDELDSFDAASRGPWGAAVFFFRTRFTTGFARLIAAWGALIVVLAVSMSPFAQQLFTFEYRPVPHTNNDTVAMVRRTLAHIDGGSILDSNGVRRAIYGGLLEFEVPEPVVCSASDCSYPNFTSLGVYSDCQDMAHTAIPSCETGAGTLNVNCTQVVYSMPSFNLSLTVQNGSTSETPPNTRRYTLLNSTTTDGQPGGSQDPTLFRFAIAQLLVTLDSNSDVQNRSDLTPARWNITACSVKRCAKVYRDLKSINGTISMADPVIADLVHAPDSPCQGSDNCQGWTVADQSLVADVEPNLIYTVREDSTPVNIRNLLRFNYGVTMGPGADSFNSDDAYNIAVSLFWNTNITKAMSRITTTYTNYLRNTSFSSDVFGTANYSETYFDVRWGWFALPAALVLSSAAFLVAVIIVSKRRGKGNEPLWKTSTVPLLLHGLENWDREGYKPTESRNAIDVKARDIHAQLRRNSRKELMFVKT